MFDGTCPIPAKTQELPDRENADRRRMTPEEEHSRQIRERTEALSNAPGKQGRRLRRALASGWC